MNCKASSLTIQIWRNRRITKAVSNLFRIFPSLALLLRFWSVIRIFKRTWISFLQQRNNGIMTIKFILPYCCLFRTQKSQFLPSSSFLHLSCRHYLKALWTWTFIKHKALETGWIYGWGVHGTQSISPMLFDCPIF